MVVNGHKTLKQRISQTLYGRFRRLVAALWCCNPRIKHHYKLAYDQWQHKTYFTQFQTDRATRCHRVMYEKSHLKRLTRYMTLKAIQGHWKWLCSIRHRTWLLINDLYNISILHCSTDCLWPRNRLICRLFKMTNFFHFQLTARQGTAYVSTHTFFLANRSSQSSLNRSPGVGSNLKTCFRFFKLHFLVSAFRCPR